MVAVSESVARAMAEGARKVSGADYAIATTGIAGPTGGSEQKPVGTVFISAAFNGNVKVEHCLFSGDRAKVRDQSVAKALDMLAEILSKS